MQDNEKDLLLAHAIAQRVAAQGGRVYLVGGIVRDALMDIACKDVDLEVYGLMPQALKAILSEFGNVQEIGASFGVYNIEHTELDIAMPRKEQCVGRGHKDFEISVDPFLTPERASMRRDFTINAMMQDLLTGELIDPWGGREDLEKRIIRRVNPATFVEDPLRAFRAAQFAARLNAEIDAETLELCTGMDVIALARERIFEETNKALLKSQTPSVYFINLQKMNLLRSFFPELADCANVAQNPIYHPEGNVFQHTMLVLDEAAKLRDRSEQPLPFMYAALFHDLGKLVATQTDEFGKITAHGHEVQGLPIIETQMHRLTDNAKLIDYVKNMSWLHMRPNMMAFHHSRMKKTREMFDKSVCPDDLILLSRADASGKKDAPYNEANEVFLRERLKDYRKIMSRPEVMGRDLIEAGLQPGKDFSEYLEYAHKLHLGGIEKNRALKQVLSYAEQKRRTENNK